jgi:hypothetical protein
MNRKDVEVKIDDKVIKIYVIQPPTNVISKADRYKAKVWTECIEDGIKTREQLGEFMIEKGIWSQESVREETDIIEKISELEKELYLGSKDKKKRLLNEGKEIAITMRFLRQRLRDIYTKRSNLEQNTAEALADNARFDYIVANCTFYENGQRVYNSIEDYNSKASDQIAYSAASKLAEMMYGYDPKTEEALPENKFLKRFGLVNDDGSLVNEDKELVDLEGRRINEFGHYVDEKGNRVDITGNPLDEDGNYLLTVEYESEDKPKEKPKTRRPRVKKTTKKTTESKTDSVAQ